MKNGDPSENTVLRDSAAHFIPGRGFGIAGMVLGICAVSCCLLPPAGEILGILGVTFSVVSKNTAKKSGAKNPFALVGAILSILGIVFSALLCVGIVLVILYLHNNGLLAEYTDRVTAALREAFS